jgi:hypothetical protein
MFAFGIDRMMHCLRDLAAEREACGPTATASRSAVAMHAESAAMAVIVAVCRHALRLSPP